MRYRDIQRRLEALEAVPSGDTTNDGYAPDSWSRLAPWAIAVHAAGGWDAALAMVKAGQPLPGYTPAQGGIPWDVAPFWQRGDTRRFPSRQQEQQVLWLISACVAELLGQGMSPSEIRRWETGRFIWEHIIAQIGADEAVPIPTDEERARQHPHPRYRYGYFPPRPGVNWYGVGGDVCEAESVRVCPYRTCRACTEAGYAQ